MHIIGILLLLSLGYVWVSGYYWLPVVLSILGATAVLLVFANGARDAGSALIAYLIGVVILWAPIWCRKVFGPNVFTTKA